MDLSKAKYILPNLFTLSSVAASFYAMLLVSKADSPKEMIAAIWLIGLSMIMDGCDGRVARATRTQSEFGVQLDSLADAIAFGIAPAFIAYKWALEPLGGLGFFVAFVFVACGIMRLARFNVLAAKETGPSNHFVGLPIPLAAGTLMAIVMAHVTMTGQMQTLTHGAAITVILVLSGLMVSSVRYRAFKKIRIRGKSGLALLALLACVVVTSVQTNTGLAFAGVLSAYILLGLTESAIGLGRRRKGLAEVAVIEAPEDLSKIVD